MQKILVAALALWGTAAIAATDQWGRTVTCAGNTCSVAGVSVTGATQSAAMATINAMPPPQAMPPLPPQTQISPLAFMQRFTTSERQAMIVASRANAQVQDWRDMVLAATYVDVTDPLTIAGVQSMESAGLLATGRAAVVLDLSKASP